MPRIKTSGTVYEQPMQKKLGCSVANGLPQIDFKYFLLFQPITQLCFKWLF